MADKKYKLTIWRFKESGKYYETLHHETDSDFYDAHAEIKLRKRDEERNEGWTWVITGEGHPGGFPMMLKY
jgi:hypothetical protein